MVFVSFRGLMIQCMERRVRRSKSAWSSHKWCATVPTAETVTRSSHLVTVSGVIGGVYDGRKEVFDKQQQIQWADGNLAAAWVMPWIAILSGWPYQAQGKERLDLEGHSGAFG